jgi:quinol monooxygenase YgiN
MVRHVVMWRLAEEAEGASKAENAVRMKQMLDALNGIVPGMLRFDVGIDGAPSEFSSDVVLYSEFTDWDALHAYADHPEHRAIQPFVTAVRTERRVVDYEV